MKYILFALVLGAVVPAALLMVYSRKLLWLTAFLMQSVALLYNQTAINFLSHETYRGTARGMEISASYLCALTLLLAILLRRGRIRLAPYAGCWLYGAYFLACVVSVMNSESGLLSFFELWKMTMLYLVLLAAWNYLEVTGDIDVFLYGMAAVVLGNFPVVIWGYFHQVYQARGVFPHQNSMGMYMVLAGNLFLARFFSGRNLWQCILFALAFAVASVSVVLCYSRGSLFCYPVGCGITIAVSLLYEFKQGKLVAALAALVLAVLVSVLFIPRVIERFEKAPEVSGQTRVQFAQCALRMMNDKALGVGVNNWGIKINPPYPYGRPRDGSIPGLNDEAKDGIVETVYLLVGAECGYGGLLLLLIWFLYHWTVAVRLLRKLAHSPTFYFAAGAVGGLSANYFQSALEWVLKQQINYMQLILIFTVIGYLNFAWKQKRMETLMQMRKETA